MVVAIAIAIGNSILMSVPVGSDSTIGAVGDSVGAAVAHRAVGVRYTVGRGAVGVGVSVDITVHAVGDLAVGADTALDATQRRSNTGWKVIWWEEVVVDVLDEDSLALHTGKYFPRGRFYV